MGRMRFSSARTASGRLRGRTVTRRPRKALVPLVALMSVLALGGTAALVREDRLGVDDNPESPAFAVGSLVAPAQSEAPDGQEGMASAIGSGPRDSDPVRIDPQSTDQVFATATLTALDFLGSLDPAQRSEAQASGLGLGALQPTQRDVFLRLARGVLGDAAFSAFATELKRNPGEYLVQLSGDPATVQTWSVAIFGDHFHARATVDPREQTVRTYPVRAELAARPSPQGPLPAAALTGIYGAAFAFFDSLSDAQREQLYTAESPQASPCLETIFCERPRVSGLGGTELNDAQRHLLYDLIAETESWGDPGAITQLSPSRANALDVRLEWSGSSVYDLSHGPGIGLRLVNGSRYFEFASEDWVNARSVYLAGAQS